VKYDSDWLLWNGGMFGVGAANLVAPAIRCRSDSIQGEVNICIASSLALSLLKHGG
jgi:hypothetical protein